MDDSKRSHDFLWIVLFLIVFINGFEAGGYQASLWNIGKNYDLSVTSMGLFASVELFATMLAPLILGGWADRTGKAKCITILLALQITAATLIFFTDAEKFFIGGVFFLGLTTSALQFISIAALIDAYPISGSKKIGYITSMYAFGALTSPLIVNYYLGKGLSWRTLFALLAIGSTVSLIGLFKTKNTATETAVAGDSAQSKNSAGEFIIGGILLLCTIMCIYVGFENGFAFFVDTLFTDVLKSGIGKYALSLFWAVMIPSRVIVGHFSKYARQILLTATAAIPIITIILTNSENSMLVLLLCIPLGFASGAIYPCVLNIMKTMAGKKTATATGMITTATGIGGVIFTALTGKFGDLFGLRKAIMCLAGFFIISFLSAYFAGKIHNRNNM